MTDPSTSDKPFTEYTPADWEACNRQSAEHLRSDADKYSDQFGPETLQRWRAADWHESEIGKEGR